MTELAAGIEYTINMNLLSCTNKCVLMSLFFFIKLFFVSYICTLFADDGPLSNFESANLNLMQNGRHLAV